MRFLIQGIGSIGQRHYRNILSLGHETALLRHEKTERPFVREFFEKESALGRTPQVFYGLDEAIASFAPQALVVANPNHLHLDASLEGLRRDLHVFIEKPVHNSLDGTDGLAREAKARGKVVMVGYNLRFHPLLRRLKTLIDTDALGKILSASVEVGENIEDWHPWEDYRDTYAPYVRSGGGSLLCFSHDIDYLFWLFGAPNNVTAGGGKVTPLFGDAEDLVQSIWKYADGRTAMLHIDYWQRPKVRTLKVIGAKATALWDAYGALRIWKHADGSEATETVPEGFERNTMFVDEMRHFIDCIERNETPLIPLSDGVEVVRIVNDMKTSL